MNKKEDGRIYQKNEILELTIEDMTKEGAGVGKHNGFPFFVKDTVTGDHIRALVMKTKKSYGYARLIEVLSPSPDRIDPRCPQHRACGGCQLQCLSYEAELRLKSDKVYEDLRRIGGIPQEILDAAREPILGMEVPERYRNKAQIPVGTDKEGNLVAGFFAGRTHRIIPQKDCLLGPEAFGGITDTILRFAAANGITAYDETTGRGLLRHIFIRCGFATGQVMVALVINGKSLPKEDLLVEELCKHDGVTSILLNSNTENTNVILSDRTRLLYGTPYIEDVLDGLRFRISLPSFYQVNPLQTVKLYHKAVEYAGLTGKETVLDLYCGIGTISLFMVRQAGKVCGIEIVPEAIEDAKVNASLNGLTNTEFAVGKAEEIGDSLRPDVIVVDPPRKGCDEACLSSMVRMAPERIVYVSCDPATLARDLKYLCENGYALLKYTPVDQFGRTGHVETVALLSKLSNAKEHIEVTVDMDELDLTSAEAKATYREIQDWVQEKYRFHVTNLNIAQVKQKYGLIERENYNKPKSPDSKQPQCPEEKVKAIEDAMRHFQMI